MSLWDFFVKLLEVPRSLPPSHAFHAHVLPNAAHDFAKEQDLEQLNSIRITEREWAMAMPTVEFTSQVGSVSSDCFV